MKKLPLAFICSPFRGDLEANAEKAREYSRQVYEVGYTPFAPHLLFPQFLDENDPDQREAGIAMGMELLVGCALIVVCGSRMTEGMAREVERARELGIPIHSLDTLARANMPVRQYAVMCVSLAKPSLLAALWAQPTEPRPLPSAERTAPKQDPEL